MAESKRIVTPYDDLTYQIIGCAMAVHRRQGPNLREDTYQRDLEAQLALKGIAFEPQRLYEVYDSPSSKSVIGYYIPDFVVEDRIVVEIKALRGVDNRHLAQVIGYLAVTGCPLGLLINFGERSLLHKRILPPNDLKDHQVNREWLFVPDALKSDR